MTISSVAFSLPCGGMEGWFDGWEVLPGLRSGAWVRGAIGSALGCQPGVRGVGGQMFDPNTSLLVQFEWLQSCLENRL